MSCGPRVEAAMLVDIEIGGGGQGMAPGFGHGIELARNNVLFTAMSSNGLDDPVGNRRARHNRCCP